MAPRKRTSTTKPTTKRTAKPPAEEAVTPTPSGGGDVVEGWTDTPGPRRTIKLTRPMTVPYSTNPVRTAQVVPAGTRVDVDKARGDRWVDQGWAE